MTGSPGMFAKSIDLSEAPVCTNGESECVRRDGDGECGRGRATAGPCGAAPLGRPVPPSRHLDPALGTRSSQAAPSRRGTRESGGPSPTPGVRGRRPREDRQSRMRPRPWAGRGGKSPPPPPPQPRGPGSQPRGSIRNVPPCVSTLPSSLVLCSVTAALAKSCGCAARFRKVPLSGALLLSAQP